MSAPAQYVISLFCLRREAFAAWIPPFGVPLSYGIAISYVIVDTIDKGAKAFQAAKIELGANGDLHPEVNRGRCLAGVVPSCAQRVPFEKCSMPACSCFDWLCVVGAIAALHAQPHCLRWHTGSILNIITHCTPCMRLDQALHALVDSSRHWYVACCKANCLQGVDKALHL